MVIGEGTGGILASRSGGITRKEFIYRGAGVAAVAGLGLGGLTSCGGGDGGGAAEIEYYHINTEAFGGQTVRDLVARFQEENPEITVTERFQNGSYSGLLQNLQTGLASGQPPDVAQIGFSYLNYAADNFPYVPVEQLVQDYAGDGFLDGIPENILDLGRSRDELVGMPYSVSNAIVYYNADDFSEAGLDPDNPPRTWEEWREAMQQITDRLDKPGLWIYQEDSNWGTEAMIESNGGQVLGCEGGEAAALFDGSEAVAAMQFWADMIEEGTVLNALYDEGTQAFLSGGVSACVDTIADRGNFQDQASFDLRATSFPSFGGREPELPAGGNALFVFSEDESKRQAAMRFVEFLASPESLTEWTRGLGYLPIRDEAAEDPQYLGDFLQENPIQRVAVAQIPLVVPWTSYPGPNGLEAQNVLFSATQEIYGGEVSAEEGLSRAAGEVNESIARQNCVS